MLADHQHFKLFIGVFQLRVVLTVIRFSNPIAVGWPVTHRATKCLLSCLSNKNNKPLHVVHRPHAKMMADDEFNFINQRKRIRKSRSKLVIQCSSETCEHHECLLNSFETRLYWRANVFTNAMCEHDNYGLASVWLFFVFLFSILGAKQSKFHTLYSVQHIHIHIHINFRLTHCKLHSTLWRLWYWTRKN